MDASDLNGGKAGITREGFNLERMFTPEIPAKSIADEDRLEDENLNGDFKLSLRNKNTSPTVKKKLRKLKVNIINSDDAHKFSPTAMKLNKRKASENVDLYSSESEDFSGFEIGEVENIELRCTVLQKLIAEVETGNLLSPKRRKVVLSKTNKHFPSDIGDNESLTDSDDEKDVDELGSNNNCPDESELKFEKSTNNSVVHSGKLRKTRFSRGASPSSAVRQKVTVDVRNPAYRIPFEYGWKRELVYRAGSSENQTRRMADIYYYTPEGKKVRSYREVIEFLTTSELTIDNFTFFKEPLGVNDPGKEIIRDAKKPRDSLGNKILTKIPKKSNEIASVKKNTPKKMDSLLPTKTLSKAIKATSTLKIKLPTKKGTLKKESKSPSLSLSDNEILMASEWTPTTKKSFQERSPLTKSKKVVKIKVQEPCSITCSSSLGLIPTLHCCICLCLYHPECAGHIQVTGSYGFICQNCKKESSVSLQNQKNPIFSPPPLIPISILNASTSNSKHQSVLLPTLQPIPKTESMVTQKLNKIPLKSINRLKNKMNKTIKYGRLHNCEEIQTNVSLSQSINDFLQKDDKFFAQNVATIGEQRFIVVPKNNSAVLCSSTNVAMDKIGNKPPVIEGTDNVRNMGSSSTALAYINVPSDSNISPKSKEAEIKVTGKKIVNTISENVHLQSHKLFQSRKILPLSFESNHMSPGINKTLRHDLEETLENIFANQDLTVNFENATKKIRKKQTLAETDHRQYFMVSICAGYHALSRIFQYLKVQELLRAARVCRMWRDIAAHPSLWKTVRMKNSQVTDWDGLADTLKYRGTQHLDLRKMLIAGEADNVWKKFVAIIPKVTSLIKLELCRCPAMVVEEVMKHCPQLEVLSAMSIKCDSFNLEFVSNLQECKELRLKAVSGMSILGDLISLSKLTNITHLSLTSVKDLGRKKVDVLHTLHDLQTLELGECSDFPEKFGTTVLVKLKNLERLRLEKGQGTCCTFDILEGISQLDNLSQLELVNFDVKSGFDKYLANCKNIKRLLIIPTYVSQSATSNNMILAGVTELSHNLTHFVWGVTQELLRVTELFVDQCNQMSKQITGDSIPVLKPVPCLKLIEDILGDKMGHKDTKQQTNLNNPQVEILPLPHLQKLLLTALPKTRVKILKIPFHATWRQSISDSTSQ